MVKENDIEIEKINTLLNKGIITKEEYDYLLQVRKSGNTNIPERYVQEYEQDDSMGKKIVSFILTIIGMGVVLFGTCLFNLVITNGGKNASLTNFLFIAWPLFPIVLFGIIAAKTKNKGMKWAVIFTILSGLIGLLGMLN